MLVCSGVAAELKLLRMLSDKEEFAEDEIYMCDVGSLGTNHLRNKCYLRIIQLV